jgi:hypothetical protein
MKTINLFKNAEKFSRAFSLFEKYITKNDFCFGVNNLDIKTIDFKVFKSFLYDFFEKNNIYVTVKAYDLTSNVKWHYVIELENNQINQDGFNERELAEYVAFIKCFQFLDTRLFIEYSKNRYIDETSDSSLLNVNWVHLNKVLNYKRKLLI